MEKIQQMHFPVGTAEGNEANVEPGHWENTSIPINSGPPLKTISVQKRKADLFLDVTQLSFLVLFTLVYAALSRETCMQLFQKHLSEEYEYHGASHRRLSDEARAEYLQLLCISRMSIPLTNMVPAPATPEVDLLPEIRDVIGNSLDLETAARRHERFSHVHTSLSVMTQAPPPRAAVLDAEDIFSDAALQAYAQHHGLNVFFTGLNEQDSAAEGTAPVGKEQHRESQNKPRSFPSRKVGLFRFSHTDAIVNSLLEKALTDLELPVRAVARKAAALSSSSCAFNPVAAAAVAQLMGNDPDEARAASEQARNALTLAAQEHCLYRLPEVITGTAFPSLSISVGDIGCRPNKTQTAKMYLVLQSLFSKSTLTQDDVNDISTALIQLFLRFPDSSPQTAIGRMQETSRNLARGVMMLDIMFVVNSLFPGTIPESIENAVKMRLPLNVGPLHPQAIRHGNADAIGLFCVIIHSFLRGHRPHAVILVHAKQLILAQRRNLQYNWSRFRSFFSSQDFQVLQTLGLTSRLT